MIAVYSLWLENNVGKEKKKKKILQAGFPFSTMFSLGFPGSSKLRIESKICESLSPHFLLHYLPNLSKRLNV